MIDQRFKVSRLEAISDGVFAIAMTLLVLELKLPEMEAPVSTEMFTGALIDQLKHGASWAISFVMLCSLWMTQHALFKDGVLETRKFTWLNFFFLGGISFIPFPTSLMGEHADQPLSTVVFSVTLVFCGLMLAFMSFVKHQPEDTSNSWEKMNGIAKRILISSPLIGLTACILAYAWKPQAGATFWLLLPLLSLSLKHKHKKKTQG